MVEKTYGQDGIEPKSINKDTEKQRESARERGGQRARRNNFCNVHTARKISKPHLGRRRGEFSKSAAAPRSSGWPETFPLTKSVRIKG